jgi:hypothetical protein
MSYTAGARVRSTVTFAPETGSTILANISATATDAEGNRTVLTVAAGATNVYTADITLPDTAISGPWVVRWECSSPKMTCEVSFPVDGSGAANP